MTISITRQRAVGAVAIAVTAVGLVGVPAVQASADPSALAAFGATGEGDALVLRTVNIAGLTNVAGLTVAPTTSKLANLDTPVRSTAASANLGAGAVGLGLAVDSDTQTAPPDHLTPSTRTLLAASLPGVLTAGAAQASDLARYPADRSVCLPQGTLLTNTSNHTAGVGVATALSVPGISPVVQTGDITTTTQTSVPTTSVGNRGTLSRTSAQIADVALLGGAGTVHVANTPVLEAFAGGSTAPRRFGFTTAPVASVKVGANTFALTTNAQDIPVPASLLGGLATAVITAKLGTATATANTPTSVAGTASVVELSIVVKTNVVVPVTLATVTVGIGAMSASATSPADGIQCANDVAPAAPVFTTPANGSTVATTTPTIAGTGATGAVVTVTTAAGNAVGTATVAADGTWSLTPATPFAEGPVSLRATESLYGLTSAAATDTFTVALPAPALAAPVISSPTNGSTVATATPPITGTGKPGAVVTVRDSGGNQIGTATVAADGTWSVTPTAPFANGAVSLRVTQTSGTQTSAAASVDFTVAAPAPALAPPVFTAPAQGSTSTDPTPVIRGTGVAGATVTVLDSNGNTIGTATVATDGTWSVTPATPFANGAVTLRATESAGTRTSSAASVDFTVAAPAPALAAPVITVPTNGSTTANPSPEIDGTGTAGATVTVLDSDGNTVGTAVVRADGTWSLTPAAPFANGPVTLRATQSTATQTSSTSSVTFSVAAPAPALPPPVFTAPGQGSTTTDPSPAITGTGRAGATVTVVDSNGDTVGTAVVAADGTWSLTPMVAFANGPVTLRASEATATQTSTFASVDFTVAAPAPALAAPVFTAPGQNSTTTTATPAITGTGRAGATVTVLDSDGNTIGTAVVAGDGTWSVTPSAPFANGTVSLRASQTLGAQTSTSTTLQFVVAAPEQVLDPPVVTTPADGSTTTDPTPTITGTGAVGATVTVLDSGGNTVGTAVVGADGTWSVTPGIPFANGAVSLRVTQADRTRVSAATTVGFTVAAPAPALAAPVVTAPVEGSTTADATPDISGTGRAGATVTVVDSGGNTIGTATVASDGTWTVTPAVPFADGTVTVRVSQSVGTQVSPSATADFTVATATPALPAPVFTAPDQGSTTPSSKPTIAGTGRAGATVTVLDSNGNTVGTAGVGSDSTWTLTPAMPFTNGPVTLRAVQATATQTSSAASLDFVVAAPAPAVAAPVVTAPAPGSTTADATPDITGTGQAGATVTVVDGAGNTVATGTVGSDGHFTVTPSVPFGDGPVSIRVVQTVGTTMSPATTVGFTVATTAPVPATPVITAPAENSTTTDPSPAITGTGTAGATITVLDSAGNSVGTATVGSGGSWTVTPAVPFANGPVTLRATQTVGAQTSPAASVDFTVAAPAPALAAPVFTSPAQGSTTTDPSPAVTGTGVAGATVTVLDARGATVGTAVVDASGTWSLTPMAPFANGAVTLRASQATQTQTSTSASVDFTVAAPAPTLAAPVFTAPGQGSTTQDPTPTISGTGRAGATVTVLDSTGATVGTTTVGSNGTWFVTPAVPFDNGPVSLRATQALGGQTSTAASVDFTVAAPAPALAAPVFTAPTQGSTTADSTPPVTGTGTAGAIVTVVDSDGHTVGTATVGSDGTWALPDTTAFANGPVSLRATEALGGQVSTADTVSFTVAAVTPAPDAPVITSPADPSTTADPTPTVSGTGVAGATVTLSDPAGSTLGTAVVTSDGRWSITPGTPLANGTVTLSAVQAVDGRTSPSDTVTITVAAPAPALAAPVVDSPANGSTTGDTTPPFTGSGAAGATITLLDSNGAVIGTGVVASDSTFSVTPDAPFAPGDVTVRVVQSTPDATSPATTVTFTVAAVVVVAPPAFTAPGQGSTTTDPTPTIRGTGLAGATVTVMDGNGTTVGTALVDAGGTWTLTPDVPFATGPVHLRAVQTSGTTDSSAATLDFTVAAPAPVLAAPVVATPTEGSTVATATPPITGTGRAGATVTVLDSGGNTVGTGVVASDGTFSVTPDLPFANGSVTISVVQSAGGQTSPATDRSFVVAVPAPALAAPVFTAPAQGSTTVDGTPAISGTGRPGATVTVLDENGATVGTAVVGSDSTWSLTPTTPFANGPVTLRATQSLGSQTSTAGSVDFTVAVPTAQLAPPAFTAPVQGSTVTTNTPSISGTGVAGATVTVVAADGTTVGSTPVAADGTWTFTSTVPFSNGPVQLRATQAAGGRTSTAVTDDFTVAAPVPVAAPVFTAPVQGSTTADPTPVIRGTGTAGALVTVVAADGSTVGTATVGTDGTWTLTPAVPFANGAVQLRATQSVDGQTSPADTVAFTVAAPVPTPAAPVVTTPADGSSTTDTTPAVTGTGAPGATVTVTDANGDVVGTGTVGPTGAFSIPATTQLPIGRDTLTVTQTDRGQTSAPTAVTVDVRPLPPVLSSPADGSTVTTNRPVITGTGLPGAALIAYDGMGNRIGTGTVGSDGTFSITPTGLLPVGATAVRVTQTLAAETSDPASNDVTVAPASLAAPPIDTPLQGSTAEPRPLISGTGMPGATVTVTSGGRVIGTATVTANGSWAVVPATALPQGAVTVLATQSTGTGNQTVTSPSTRRDFRVAPEPMEPPPVIESPADQSTQPTGQPPVTGTGKPGSIVDVYQVGQGYQGSAEVKADGSWTMNPTPGFSEGVVTVISRETGSYLVPSAAAVRGAYTMADVRSSAQATRSITSSPSNTVTFTTATPAAVHAGGTLTAVAPYRLLDTRTGLGNGGVKGRQRTVSLQVGGVGGSKGAPSTGVREVVLNVTTTNSAAAGALTVYPSLIPKPVASNLNYLTDRASSNLVTVPIGDDGKVLLSATGATQMVVDLEGYYSTRETASDTSGRFTPLDPARLVDTRIALGIAADVPTNSTRDFQVTGRGGVPTSGVSAVVLNLTSRIPTRPGYLTLFPSGTPRPTQGSNLNFAKGESRAVRVIVPVGADGKVSLYNFAGPTQVVVDVNGYFGATGDYFVGLSPRRAVDTRVGTTAQEPSTALVAGGTDPVAIAGQNGVPVAGKAGEPVAVVGNVTAVDPSAYGHMIIYPSDVARQDTSDLNYTPHSIIPNELIARVGRTDGGLEVYSFHATVDLVVDLNGFFVRDPLDGN